MRRINVNLYPKDGFRYKEADGSIHGGPNWRAVIEKVRAYRKRNNLPPGNPEQEVHEQACQHSPHLCYQESEVTRKAQQVVSLKGRVLKWFRETKSSGGQAQLQFVNEETAKARAAICAQCPKSSALPESCSSCKAAVSELRKDLIGGRPVDARVTQHGCLVLGLEPAAAAWIDQPTVPEPELPDFCWRKKTV